MPRTPPPWRVAWLASLVAVVSACASERKVNPPPEGEWLEWEPKKDGSKHSEPPSEAKPGKNKNGLGADTEDLDQPASKPKPSAPAVACDGRDMTRESLCIALSEMGEAVCPDAMPARPEAKQAGNFDEPPKAAKRDASLEASQKQCCYAWCAKVPSAAPPVPCQGPEPLFCFEAPKSTKNPSPPPYAECPIGLKRSKAKGRHKATPNASFSAKLTKEERAGEPKACCYQACK